MSPEPTLTEVTRRVAALLADFSPWPERDLQLRVSFRPVGGHAVWRSPLPGVLAAQGGPRDVVARVTAAMRDLPVTVGAGSPGTLEIAPAALDLRALLPHTPGDMRLWQGDSTRVEVGRPREAGLRGVVLAEAVTALARAVGDIADVSELPGRDLVVRREADEIRRRVADLRRSASHETRRDVRGAQAGEAPSAIGLEREAGRTPLRAAVLIASPGEPLILTPEHLRRRVPSQAGFAIAHGALTARRAADAAGYARREPPPRLVDALMAYPFVVGKAAMRADPGLVLRHLLIIAERAPAAFGPVAASAEAVLTHGMGALGLEPPSRI